VVQLERWDPDRDVDRLGIDELRYEILGIKVPLIRMPVAPGRSLGVLVEVAARNQLLRTRGLNAARDLANRLEQTLREKDLQADADADDEEHGGHV
jgi:HPr kinase/phosphorylase